MFAFEKKTDVSLECASVSTSYGWTGYVANVLLPSEFHNTSTTNTIFVLTLLIAMANDARTSTLSAIDGLVLMHLCGGTVFGVLSLWGYRTRMYFDNGPRAISMFGGFATHVKLFVSLGVSIFGLWFWLYGVVGGLEPMGPNDGADPPNAPRVRAAVYLLLCQDLRERPHPLLLYRSMLVVHRVLRHPVAGVKSRRVGERRQGPRLR